MSHEEILEEQQRLLNRKLMGALFTTAFTILAMGFVVGAITKSNYIEVRDKQSGQVYRIKESDFKRSQYRMQQRAIREYQEKYGEPRMARRGVDKEGYAPDEEEKYLPEVLYSEEGLQKLPPELANHIRYQMMRNQSRRG